MTLTLTDFFAPIPTARELTESILSTHFIFLPEIAAIFIVFTFIWGQFNYAKWSLFGQIIFEFILHIDRFSCIFTSHKWCKQRNGPIRTLLFISCLIFLHISSNWKTGDQMGDRTIIGWGLALATLYNLHKQVHPYLAKVLLSWLESKTASLWLLQSYFGNRQSFMIIWLQGQQRYDVITKSALKLQNVTA